MILFRLRRPFGFPYLDYVNGHMVTRYCACYTPLTADYLAANSYTLSDTVTGGWFVVSADVTATQRIVCSGDVHLILCDGKTLNAEAGGISVNDPSSLTVYAQTSYENDPTGATMGALTARPSDNNSAAIGSDEVQVAGSITINGGKVSAINSSTNWNITAAGIGSGRCRSSPPPEHITSIVINDGIVTAQGGQNSAGIGSGSSFDYSRGGVIEINGGHVTAHGRSYGAGIGSSSSAYIETIKITGGVVTADSNYGCGIGPGGSGAGAYIAGNVSISGGTVTASSTNGMGIGGRTITITGGAVTATSTNGAGIGEGTTASGTLTLGWQDNDASSGLPRITASSYQVNTINYSTAAHTFAAATAPTTALTTEEIKTLTGATIIPTEVT